MATKLTIEPHPEVHLRPTPATASRRVVGLPVEFPADAIPPWRCPVCGGSTAVTALRYQVPFSRERQPFLAVVEHVPGDRCAACDVEAYEVHASLEAIRAVLAVVLEAGDSVVAQRLEASLTAGQQHLAAAVAR